MTDYKLQIRKDKFTAWRDFRPHETYAEEGAKAKVDELYKIQEETQKQHNISVTYEFRHIPVEDAPVPLEPEKWEVDVIDVKDKPTKSVWEETRRKKK